MAARRFSLLANLFANLRGNDEPQAPRTQPSRYQAIAIFRGATCCSMARKFSEHRFLAREAPSLPLKGCTMPQGCQCAYLRFKDRRGESRRLDDFNAATRRAQSGERRGSRGRRSSD